MVVSSDDDVTAKRFALHRGDIGGRHTLDDGRSRKTPILGVIERGGRVQAQVVERATTLATLKFLDERLTAGATLYSDQSPLYYQVSKTRSHESINHANGEYARGEVHTNTIEGFWSQIKRSLDGTHHSVSRKHLNRYVQEFVFRYNHRREPIFPLLIALAAVPVR